MKLVIARACLFTTLSACFRSAARLVFCSVLFGQFISGHSYAADLDVAPFSQGVFSGTEPFNTSGKCHEPGDDCGSEDARVRTGDLMHFAWSITTSDFVPGDADFAAVIFEQTLKAEDTALVRFDRIPTVCLAYPAGPGGDNPASTLTDNADGSQTLMCNLGAMGEGAQKSFSIPVRPSANSVNGSQFRSTQLAYALDDAGRKVVANKTYIDSTVYEVSAAPAFDLMADRKDMYQGQRVIENLGNGAGPEAGTMVYINAHIAVDALRKGKGVEALDDTVSFKAVINATNKDGVTAINIPYKMIECLPNPSRWSGTVYGNKQLASEEPLAAKVSDSGTCTFSGEDLYGHKFTLSGIDSQGIRYPTETTTGESLVTGPYFVAAYQIGFFVPFSAIEASDGDLSGNGGAVNLSTCLSDFDPKSDSGVSNYASNVEPGYNGSAMPDGSASNNCTGPLTLQISSGGGYNHRLVSTVDDNGNYELEPLIDIAHLGATSVEATTRYAHMETFANTGIKPLDDFQACMKFDNTVSKLIDASFVGASKGQYGFVADDDTASFDHSKWQVLYGSADFGDDSPIDRNADGARDFDATTGRFEGNWETMRSVVCADNLVPRWVSDPEEIGIDNVNVVRFIGRGQPVSINPGQTFRAFLPLQMRAKFVGGENDGENIPVGTVAAGMSSFRSEQFYPEWRPIQYVPSPESSQGDGDRVTFTRISVNALLSTETPLAPAGVTESVLAGYDVVWKIAPSVTSSLPAGGTAQGLSIVSVLPEGSSYNSDCTAQLANGLAPALVRYNQPAVGQQTLTWELGDVHSSDEVLPVRFCASTDSFGAEGSLRINKAYATAVNATASVPTSQSIILGQAGEIRAAALVDVVFDGVNDTQEHTLKWVNFSDATSIAHPTIINVLPFNGDAAGDARRSPASEFSGTLTLLSEPTLSFNDNSVPAAGEQPLGSIHYSADDAISIADNPNTNTSHWCTYIDKQFESVGSTTGDCPVTLFDVTAIKYISNYELARNGNPRQGQLLSYTVSAQGNEPGNRYTNTFSFDSDDLTGTQTVRSRPSSLLIISHSIGDLIFVDVNQDGKYSSQIDVLAPDGIVVELRRESDDSLLASTATQNGTFLFDLLGDGDYYVMIPASEFATDQALRDWNVAPEAKESNANANQNVDHSGIATGKPSVTGIRTDVITLSTVAPSLPVDAPTGLEPLGDNTFGLKDNNTNDDFSNLTIDIGLVSGDADKDGVPDIVEFGTNTLTNFVDSDNDGLPNYLDADSDNDGISDGVEAGITNTSTVRLSVPDGVVNSPSGVTENTDKLGSAIGTANENRINDLYLLGMLDSDNDQQPDYLDQDSDNDAIPDALERGIGSAGTTIQNVLDEDGDGIANYLDLDSDNDGIFDSIEANTLAQAGLDSDRDGITDQFDVTNTGGTDANADGVDDSITLIDRDKDGKPDYSDTDSDNDGFSDLIEYGGADSDGDGFIDNFTDTDNNGVHDGLTITEAPVKDTDNDGVPDTHDIDTDGDSVPDSIEAMMQRSGDIDKDGLPAQLDLDSDNDGIHDGIEFGATFKDSDGDDIDDRFDVDATAGLDVNVDGIDDQFQSGNLFDTDGDGVVDASDIDSDNDGFIDAVEFGFVSVASDAALVNFIDANGDGLNDNAPADYADSSKLTLIPDSDGDGRADYIDADSDDDGIPDALESPLVQAGTEADVRFDADADGIPNHLDSDSDNDGIHDRFEAQTLSMDADQDGISNLFDVDVTGGEDENNDGIDDRLIFTSLLDSDRDGTPDHLDLDSDGDNISDIVEAGGSDINNDGKVDGFKDADRNGANDGLGPIGLIPVDSDKDGAADFVDSDADNDGVPDFAETGLDGSSAVDSDADGIPDYRDNDSDNDGISDGAEAGFFISSVGGDNLTTEELFSSPGVVYYSIPAYRILDTDGDGLFDFRDIDSDNDGVSDAEERGAELLPVDSDQDSVADHLDVDSDNDGIPDLLEGRGDADNDGVADRVDSDSDNDGIADAFETGYPRIDSDSDGIVDWFDTDTDASRDSDNDGIRDTSIGDGLTDIDDDGIPDFRDNDSDGDGIPDAIEFGNVLSGVDTNADGTADFLSTDSDGDGVPDSVEYRGRNPSDSNVDSDNDTIPDYRDSDSDNDGIPDSHEAGYVGGMLRDTDGDGTPDMRDTDSDNDSIADAIEGAIDTDADGQADYLDEDANNDGVPDAVQGTSDSDGNGIVDRLQTGLAAISIVPGKVTPDDSDGDGIPDSIESGLAGVEVSQTVSVDTDNDGTPDLFDLDSDNDGIPDQIEAGTSPQGPLDTDNDGQYDFRDSDSDNDGINDVVEGRLDFDGDGEYDAIDLDSDNDGVPDEVELHMDSDGDGLVNRHDLDSDNDGVSDSAENGTIRNTTDEDSISVELVFNNYVIQDTDGDGIADFIDTDSDNDGLSDSVESRGRNNLSEQETASTGGTAGTNDSEIIVGSIVSSGLVEKLIDSDADGIPDLRDSDSDNDGINDSAELDADTDGDGVPDYLDRDSNGNGVDDQVEPTRDSDNDGIPDNNDVDNDNDGVPDGIDGYGDSDKDGLANYIDTDSDGDGIPDTIEAGKTPSQKKDSDLDGVEDRLDLDSDNDGIIDELETAIDSDGDGVPDYIDTDSDNDGISDLIESGGLDADGDGQLDSFIDKDKNGASDEIALSELDESDSDNDGLPDRIEVGSLAQMHSNAIDIAALIDSDNDGIPDSTEGFGDHDNDGLMNNLDADSDNDGLLDEIEAGFTLFTVRDSDADGHPDFIDNDSDNDGLSDVAETLGLLQDENLDGIIDGFVDEDRNGVDDSVDSVPVYPEDLDNDGVPDYLDLDTDGDGRFDLIEANGNDVDMDGLVDGMRDSDADTIPDSVDADVTNGADVDGDGIVDIADADFAERKQDQDRDGIADVYDIDPDGNGFAATGANDGAPSTNWPDSNGDGIPDVKQHVRNAPVPAAAQALDDEGIIHTGTDGEGSGCSITTSPHAWQDPSLWLLIVGALSMLIFRTSRKSV